MVQTLPNSFLAAWHEVQVMTPRIVAALALLLFFVWLGRLVGRTLGRLLAERGESKVYLRFLQQLATWLLALLGLILALNILGLGNLAMSLMAGGGMAAVVFGFAFREIGENFIAGFFLTFSRSFEVGDYIASEGLSGEVKTIELRHIHIRTPDGCDIFIPSAQIFKSPLHNFTRDGLRRPSFVVGIDYADNPEQARTALLAVVKETTGVLAEPAAEVLTSALLPQYVELQVTFWVNTFDQSATLINIKNRVMDRCCQLLKDEGFTLSANCSSNINLATPTALSLRRDAPQ
jgi:small conductance mechanosensitive channel